MSLLRRLLLLIAIAAAAPMASAAGNWNRLPPLPDPKGFAGAYCGVSNGILLVAGGSNFPDKPPWEGGAKVWYDTVYALDRLDGTWRVAGHLPRPLAYGVSITHQDTLICIGGGDSKRNYPDVFRLEFKEGKLSTTPLPPLPKSLASAAGALLNNTLYIATGQQTPNATEASKSIYTLDLAAAKPTWREIDPLPGPARILPTAAAFNNAFYLSGGAELTPDQNNKPQRHYLKDAYRFDRQTGWHRIADLPHPIVAAPSPAPTDPTGFYLLGGDDGSQVTSPPDQHRGFSRSILRYDAKHDQWTDAGEMPADPPVTTSVAGWRKQWIIPTGEIHPGIRSPSVWSWTPTPRE